MSWRRLGWVAERAETCSAQLSTVQHYRAPYDCRPADRQRERVSDKALPVLLFGLFITSFAKRGGGASAGTTEERPFGFEARETGREPRGPRATPRSAGCSATAGPSASGERNEFDNEYGSVGHDSRSRGTPGTHLSHLGPRSGRPCGVVPHDSSRVRPQSTGTVSRMVKGEGALVPRSPRPMGRRSSNGAFCGYAAVAVEAGRRAPGRARRPVGCAGCSVALSTRARRAAHAGVR
jgi:hypothetical protein